MKANLKKFIQTEYFFLLIILAISFAIMMPILIKGIPFGYDLPHHYQCALTFVESIQNGDFYPSWSANRNYGFGGMETRLYPPISHYSLALSFLLIGDWHLASWATFTIFTFIGGLGVYLWAKEYMPSSQAVFAGAIYILLPYHLNQLYNTFFYAEYIGSCVLPFSFYFLSRVCRRGETIDVIGLTIAFAILILTHLPLTVIGSICLAIYGLTLLNREQFFSQVTKLGLGVLGGLGASSFFWTKVLLERNLMAKTLIYEDPWLDYRLHFLLTPIQTFVGELRERIYETATFYYDLMFFYAVILALLCTIPFFLSDKRSKFSMRGVWLIFGLSVFLILPFSQFIWDALPFLQEVQFPWRWVAVVSIFASLLSASQLHLLIDWFKDKKRPFALIICGGILAVVAFSLSQIVRQAPHIEKNTTAKMMSENAKAIGFKFWWTIWTNQEAFENKEKVTVENRNVLINSWGATNREFHIGEGWTTKARIATFYHPNWKVTVNGSLLETEQDENGAILIPLTSEKSVVKLNFVEPLEVVIGGWISLSVWLCLLLLFLRNYYLKTKVRRFLSITKPPLFFNKTKYLEKAKTHYVILASISFFSLLPAIFMGIYQGVDLSQHVQFSTTFHNSILNGEYYPSWAANENLGFGGIGVRFYPPLVPFFYAFLKIILLDWHTATWVLLFVFNSIGSFGIYLLAKEYLESKQAVWAGMVFVLMPYHIYQIQNGSQFAEFAGYCVIPFSFLYVTRICKRSSFADVLGLSIAFAILVLTHLPTTVIGSISLLIYSLVLIPKDLFYTKFVKLSISVFFGLLASSIYWIKVVSELGWLRNTKYDKNHFYDYSYNFLLTSPWFGEKQLWFLNTIFISYILIFIASGIIIFLIPRTNLKPKFSAIVLVFLFSLLMCVTISQPIWLAIPFLSQVQFPWRWLTIASITGSIVTVVLIESFTICLNISKFWGNLSKFFLGALLVLLLFIFGIIWTTFQLNYIPRNEFDTWVNKKTSEIGCDCFWTIHADEKMFLLPNKVTSVDRNFEIKLWNTDKRIFSVDEGLATDIRVATLYYPHWKATVNEKEVEVKLAEDGTILIPVSTETSTVRLWFEEPARVKIATLLSTITWLIFLGFGIFLGFSYVSKKRDLSSQSTLKTL